MKNDVKKLFENLSLRERDVIIMLFGLDGIPRSPEEIGALYCVDKEEILKIADKALSKIPATIEELKEIAKEAQEELKNRLAERKPRRTISDNNELLNINFFENSEK